MSPPDPAVIRSRGMRERILRLLDAAYRGAPDAGVPHAQIVDGFSTGQVSYGPAEIQAELIDLVDDGLVSAAVDEWSPSEKLYRITTRGRDFVRGRFPWGRVDEFTGADAPGAPR